MSIVLPADLAQRLKGILAAFGEPVTYTSPDGSVTWTAMASIQSPVAAGLVGDIDQDAMILFISALDVPVAPVKMGTFLVRSIRRTIEDVVLETPGGSPTNYMVRARG
jgi:hypothetical protein